MAEITVDTLSGEIKVSDKDKSFVIKTDNIFRAKLYNDNFVCVLTDANTPNEKELLYDLNGELIYEFYRRQSRVIFMKNWSCGILSAKKSASCLWKLQRRR